MSRSRSARRRERESRRKAEAQRRPEGEGGTALAAFASTEGERQERGTREDEENDTVRLKAGRAGTWTAQVYTKERRVRTEEDKGER